MPTYTNIIENLFLDETLVLSGHDWDNTLIRNVTIRNVSSGDGILLRDVNNVRIENCTIDTVEHTGIRLAQNGSTENVTIVNNTITNTGANGISAGQRVDQGHDQVNLQIIGNTIDMTGLKGGPTEPDHHGMYIQATDFLIQNNHVTNSTDANAFSVRSSGVITGNLVDGAARAAVTYYADHMTGPSDTLIIENNVFCNAEQSNISLLVPDADNVVGSFIIRNNYMTESDRNIRTSDVEALGIYPEIYGNQTISLSEASDMIDARLDSIGAPPDDGESPGPTPDPDAIVGTDGDDVLTGTDAADLLEGGAGRDVLNGGAGDDTLTGGQGGDTFIVSAGNGSDTIADFYPQWSDVVVLDGYTFGDFDALGDSLAQVGDDTVVTLSATESLTLRGVSVSDLTADEFVFTNVSEPPLPTPNAVTGTDGDDVLTGTDAADLLEGGAGRDVLNGGAGDDTLTGGQGGDTFIVSAGNGSDTIADFYPQWSDVVVLDGYTFGDFDALGDSLAQVGDDTVITLSDTETLTLRNVSVGDLTAEEFAFTPRVEPLTLTGTDGNDVLIGDAGDDTLVGAEGRDVLDGGAGDDTLTGGRDGDTFVMAVGSGHDTVTDFYTQWSDVIELRGYGFDDFNDLDGRIVQQNDDTVINLPGGDTLTLLGVNANDLSAGEFMIA